MRHVTKVDLAVFIGFPILIGLVLGANQTRAGAFLPWHLSIAYWVIISLATWLTLALATWICDRALRPWTPPSWIIWLIGGILGSIAARYVIYVTASAFHPMMTNAELRTMPPIVFDAAFARYYMTNWSAILAMWIAACWVRYVVRAKSLELGVLDERLPSEAPNQASSATLPSLFLRLPHSIGNDIIALHSQDHYLQVFTKLGDALILGRLSDAIEACNNNGIIGSRIHRSWWVAHAAVSKSEVQGRKIFVLLENGIKIPVSQSYKELARRVGLLTDDIHKNMLST